MKRYLLLLGFLIMLLPAKGQQLITERFYRANTLQKSLFASTLTKEGNVAFSGSQTTSSLLQSLLILVEPDTDSLWVRNGPLVTYTGRVVQTAGGRFAYTGYTALGAGAYDAYLQLSSTSGQPLGTVMLNSGTTDISRMLLAAPGGGYYIGGSGTANGVFSHFMVTRTDSAGNVLWRKQYDKVQGNDINDMQYTQNGNLLLAGRGAGGYPYHLKLAIINQHGDSLLERTVVVTTPSRNEMMSFQFHRITPLAGGGYIITARSDTTINNFIYQQGMVVKVDANLMPVWHYINHSYPANVIFNKARELADGSILVGAMDSRSNINKFYFYHFNVGGTLLNTYTFTSSAIGQLQIYTLDFLPSDSTYLVGGNSRLNPTQSNQALYLAKVKFPNLPVSVPLLPTPAAQPPNPTGIKPEHLAANQYLGQSYPNPTQAEAVIPFSLPKDCVKATITINDVITGRQLKSYALKTSESSLTVDLSRLSSGIYTYTLIADGKPLATKKLSVIH